MRWERVEKIFKSILEEIDYKNDVMLVSPNFWDKVYPKSKIETRYGYSHLRDKIITVKYDIIIYEVRNSLWHELLHLIYPSKTEIWIDFLAGILAGNKRNKTRKLLIGILCKHLNRMKTNIGIDNI